MEEKKDDNLQEGKKPEDMTADELESFISTQSKVIAVNPDGTRQKDEEKKETVQEVKKEETPQEPPKEQLILGKFKSEKDVIEAYANLEKKLGEQGGEVGKLKKKTEEYQGILSQLFELDENGVPVRPKSQPQAEPQQDPLAQIRPYFPDLPDTTLYGIIGLAGMTAKGAVNEYKKTIEKDLEPLYEIKFERDVEKQRKQVKDKYEDFADFESEVNEKLTALPRDLRGKEGAVETIFLTVRGSHVPELLERAKSGVLKEKVNIENKKEEIFVESGGRSSVPTPPVDVNKMTSAQLEAFINSIKR